MNLQDKNILITGGTGFVGSTIVNKLILENCKVNIIDIDLNEFLWRIEKKKNCNFFKVDLRNKGEIEKCIHEIQPEIIMHLAAFVNPEHEINTIDEAYSLNLNGTKNLILALNEFDYDLFINTGTSDEYGIGNAPFMEISREYPISPYSVSKVAATNLCEMISKIYDKPLITVRPFLIYGPKQISSSLVPSLIFSGIEGKKISLTPCKQTRDFIFVEDVANAYISLAKNVNKVKNMGIFNIGSGKETQILEIVNLIKVKLKDTKFLIGDKPYRHGEQMRLFSSIKKIKETIEWTPKWNIEDGIDETIDWYLKNREIWKKYMHILH